MKQSIVYNKKFAVCATIIVISLSFLFGGTKSLNAERNKAVREFRNGSDGKSIAYYVESISDIALGDIALNAQSLNMTDDKDIKALLSASTAVRNAENSKNKSVDKYYENYRAMITSIDSLKRNDASLVTNLIPTTVSLPRSIIRNDNYNAMAADFNKELNKVPALIFKLMGMAKTLPVFTEVD